MNRQDKKTNVAAYKSVFEGNEFCAITHYRGLTVAQITELRSELRNVEGEMRITKNSLAKIAIDGTAFAELGEYLTGPTAIVYGAQPVAAAKVLASFSEDNDNFEVIAGGLGEVMMDAAGMVALSKLPSLEELRGKMVALLQTPAQRMVTVTQAPAAQLARVLMAYSEKGE